MKISIIIAIYNSDKYLEETIKSVLAQSFTDFELLLIDDGSKDNSWSICQEYAKKDNRIRAIHQENQGVSNVRNLGISESKGEYIRFFDADDIMEKNSLEALMRPLENNPDVGVSIGQFDSNDNLIFKGDGLSGVRTISEMAEHFLKYVRSFYYGVAWNKLYRAEIIKKYDIKFETGLKWSEDLLFNLLYFARCDFVYYVNQPVCYYFRRKNSLSSVAKNYDKAAIISIERRRFEAIYRFAKSIGLPEKTLNDIYTFYFSTVNQTFNGIMQEPETCREKYHKVFSVASNKKIYEVVNGYEFRNPYLLNRLMISFIRRKQYTSLFLMYYLKYLVKKNKKIQKRLIEKETVLPKFPL